jgi:hypothetical protein
VDSSVVEMLCAQSPQREYEMHGSDHGWAPRDLVAVETGGMTQRCGRGVDEG